MTAAEHTGGTGPGCTQTTRGPACTDRTAPEPTIFISRQMLGTKVLLQQTTVKCAIEPAK